MNKIYFIFLVIICASIAVPISCNTPVKIAFFISSACVRGVEVSTYDYADYNEKILNNESFIISYTPYNKKDHPDYPGSVKEKFFQRFTSRFYECSTLEEMEDILKTHTINIIYFQKSGVIDDKISKVSKNAVHAVFPEMQPHGDRYATISQWLSNLYPELNLPSVPYMVTLPDVQASLREELNIPADALVFGRHGGSDSFDLHFVKEAICEAAQKHNDWYFLFLNTNHFCDLPNVIFLPSTANMMYKTKFINSCDAMIHARWRGETFGLACAEFSIKNKPIITWLGSPERNHIEILKDKGLYYTNKENFLDILELFSRNKLSMATQIWDAYTENFSPEKVMQKFDAIFIQPLIKPNGLVE